MYSKTKATITTVKMIVIGGPERDTLRHFRLRRTDYGHVTDVLRLCDVCARAGTAGMTVSVAYGFSHSMAAVK